MSGAMQKTARPLRAAASSAVNGSGASTASSSEGIFEIERFQEHQAACKRLTHAEEAKTLVELSKYGVLSTISSSMDGHPSGSLVGFANAGGENLVFAFSSLSSHTRDIMADGRFALTVTGPTGRFRSAGDARVTLHGNMSKLEGDEEIRMARSLYLESHPDAFWVDFGDFSFMRMESLVDARLVGGFARAGRITAEAYAAAQPCPVSKFSEPVAVHMNADHMDATIMMIKAEVGLEVDAAEIVSLDKYGMDVMSTRNVGPEGEEEQETFKLRLPFPSEAATRKDLKDLIVQMTKSAQSEGSS